MTETPPAPSALIEHINRRDCVLFVGDALDEEGPQSVRLAAALVDACGAHCEFCRPDQHCSRPRACVVPLTRAAQLYEKRTNRHSLLDFVLQRVDNSRAPGPSHRALAALPVRVMVTTAYDDRLEAALRLQGRPFLSVVRDADIPFDDPRQVQLIRLHGTVSQPDSLVLTENDAADLFARLPTVTRILQAHFASKTLLFVGYQLGDPHFLALHRQVTGPIARYQRMAYAVQWPPDPLAADRWRGEITVLAAEPLPFLTQLRHSIRLQAVRDKRAALPKEPYKFLDYYERDDASIFFGRDLESDLLLSTVLAHKLTIFYGRSGTGKTSLLLTRVAPALEAQDYRVVYARMLDDPATEVKAAVRGVPAGQLAHADMGRGLAEVLADALQPAGRLVVILDQFEEFFIRQGHAVRRAFARELADCLAREDMDLRFVLSQRDDYLGALDEMADSLPDDIFAHRFRLENLTREKALLAILKPAEAFGLPVEEALREQLIADLEDQGLEPASLQIVLYRLYRDALEQKLWQDEEKQGTGLTLARYQAMGGTHDILTGYLDEVLAALPGAGQQQAARAVLKSMVTAERTKAAVTGHEISRGDLTVKVGLAEAQLAAILDHLRQKRVVRIFGEDATEGGRYELAHEVMVDKVWAWISDEELWVLDIRDLLRRAMGDWRKFGHLLGRDKLELVQSCCEVLPLDVDELELLFRSALMAGYEVGYWLERAGRAGVAVTDILREGLLSARPNARAEAAGRLGDLRLAESVPWLAAALDDSYPHVQASARAALQRIGSEAAQQAVRDHPPQGMIYISAGEFVMGHDSEGDSDEKPAHTVYVAAFYVAKYPVTHAEYARFVECTGRRPPGRWPEGQIPPGKEDHPVVNVTWYDAHDYAEWAGMRLLTEAEWEKAASWEAERGRGGEGGRKRRYPWGDEFDKKRCNMEESGFETTTPVGMHSPHGDSPYGCADMAGNVWEWTSSVKESYPYRADDGRESLQMSGSRALRGGAWSSSREWMRCAFRTSGDPYHRRDNRGFRVGMSCTASLQVLGAGC